MLMITIDLKDFGPILSSKESGQQIYDLIIKAKPRENKITIDLQGIKSMATYCAKQIFGTLYVELTPPIFSKQIVLANVSEDVKAAILLGIRFAVSK